MRVAIVDALGSASGVRQSARDAVGCGPRRVAGILESQGLGAKILTAEDAINRPDLMDGFDILMVSAMSIDKQAVQKIINLWRHKYRHKPAIAGGPIASQPENLLRSGFDVAVVGEGENSLMELLKNGLKNGELLTGFQRTILVE
nr:cobalamin-dependent protein [Candidatus Njordarchaeum guaymaensis]